MTRTLALNSEVKVVCAPEKEGGRKTTKTATVIEVVTPTSARVAFDKEGNHTALVTYSLGGEPNTFHYADEKVGEAAAAPNGSNGSR